MHESKQAQYSTVGGAEQLIRQAIGAKQWSYSTGTKDTDFVPSLLPMARRIQRDHPSTILERRPAPRSIFLKASTCMSLHAIKIIHH